MTDFAQLGARQLRSPAAAPGTRSRRSRATSSWRCRPPIAGGRRSLGGDDSVIDSRGNTVVIHYGLVRAARRRLSAAPRRRPRRLLPHAPSRTSAATARTPPSSATSTAGGWSGPSRSIRRTPTSCRCRKKKIVFWIEKTVPRRVPRRRPRGHPRMEQGVREDRLPRRHRGAASRRDEDFDPEDINYNTFRWITTDRGFAMGPSRANPLTGEILDADIIFDADMVRYWKQEQQVYSGERHRHRAGQPDPGDGHGLGPEPSAAHAGTAATTPAGTRCRSELPTTARCAPAGDSAGRVPVRRPHEVRAGHGRDGAGRPRRDQARREGARRADRPGDQGSRHARGRPHARPAAQLQGQHHAQERAAARHRASPARRAWSARSWITPRSTSRPRASSRATTSRPRIGPYDYWAIEYAYKPLSGGTEGESRAARRSPARAPSPATTTAPTRTCSARPTRSSTVGTWAPTR